TDVRIVARDAYNDEDGQWSPDDREIAFISDRDGDREVYLMDANGRNVRRLTRMPGIKRAIAWSPDGKSIAFTNELSDTSQIYLVAVPSLAVTRLTGN